MTIHETIDNETLTALLDCTSQDELEQVIKKRVQFAMDMKEIALMAHVQSQVFRAWEWLQQPIIFKYKGAAS